MASAGNPNQPGRGPLDMHKPSKPPPTPPVSASGNPNPQYPNNPNLMISSPFPQPSASYPPPTGGGGGGSVPYSFAPQTSQFHLHIPQYSGPPPQGDGQFANTHQQRSMSFPKNPNSSPHHGARIMALLGAPPSAQEIQQPTPTIQPTSSGSDLSAQEIQQPTPSIQHTTSGSDLSKFSLPMIQPSMLFRCSKLPKGMQLIGDHSLYDIDVRLSDEVQPELVGTRITKSVADPQFVLGRQVAVSNTLICFEIRSNPHPIRVLNMDNRSGLLLKGLAQRVTDMAFFAEDVHLLACGSGNGRVYIWKITEGQDEGNEPQITSQIVIAIQIVGEGESFHPRVCWHCHKQEILVVGIGKRVLKIDTTKVEKGEVFSAEEPLRCPVDHLVEGVQLVGTHDGEVTDLSRMSTLLASASEDGTIKVWEDCKSIPIAVLKPHDGQPVNFVTFLAAPNNPEHIILITGGPLNQEVKIWSSASGEGWLVPSDAESWHCTQTLELKSSAETRVGEACFNQVVSFSQAGLLLVANAKKNAIYAVHLEYGPNPAATRMDYITKFTVTLPILSFTGTTHLLPNGELIVQVYCVQTQAIHGYALRLSQSLPLPDNAVFERSESSASSGFSPMESFLRKSTGLPISSSTPKLPTEVTTSQGFDVDALWVRLQESAKQEKLLNEDLSGMKKELSAISHTVAMVENIVKNLPGQIEHIVKNELNATVEQTVSPIIEKALTSTISEALDMKGVGDKNNPRKLKLLASKLFRKK